MDACIFLDKIWILQLPLTLTLYILQIMDPCLCVCLLICSYIKWLHGADLLIASEEMGYNIQNFCWNKTVLVFNIPEGFHLFSLQQNNMMTTLELSGFVTLCIIVTKLISFHFVSKM